jgi:hypothetical protein
LASFRLEIEVEWSVDFLLTDRVLGRAFSEPLRAGCLEEIPARALAVTVLTGGVKNCL